VNVRSGRVLPPRLRRRAATPASALSWYGLMIFTFFFVTARLPPLFTEFGIYLALLGLMVRPQGVGFPPPLRWAVVFLLWTLMSALFAIEPDMAWPALIERLKALVIFFVVVNVLRTPQQLRFYVLLILVAFAIYPARGTLIGYVRGNTLFGRAIWNQIYANPNYLGALTLLMLGSALSIATVKTQNKRVRQAAAALVLITLLIILLTQSRGVFLGLLVGFGPPLLARLRKRPSGMAPVFAILAVIAVLVPAASWHRLESITQLSETIAAADKQGRIPVGGSLFDRVASASAVQRFEVLKTGLHIAASHPFLGVGIGCYNEANARYAPQLGERDAHNTYVRLAAEMGFPGLLLWLGLVGSVLAQVRRRRARLEADDRTIQILWIEKAVIGFLVAGFFASSADLTMFYLFLGILWAASNMLGGDATEPAEATVPPARRALRAR
jgi:putative inorganic carbon (HCO3(-)) transporter